MNALQSYSSDEETSIFKREKQIKSDFGGTNYDNIGMDISEDSDEDSKDKNHKIFDNMEDKIENKSTLCDRDFSERLKSREESREKNSTSSQDTKDDSRKRSDFKDRDSDRERSGRDRDRYSYDKDKDRRDHDRDRDRHDHHRRDDRDRDRRHRSRSRERRYRSRSRSRERRRRTRSRSRSRDRRHPGDSRRAAQHKYASMRSHPDFDQSEIMRRTMVEQIEQVEKETGVKIPTYYNPAIMNPFKLAEQERKKKLLWGNKSKEPEDTQKVTQTPPIQDSLWANTKFSNDNDGKMAEKFKRLMGVKASVSGGAASGNPSEDLNKKQESLFNNMEKQYETARMTTHTQRGFGLGFSSSQGHPSFQPK